MKRYRLFALFLIAVISINHGMVTDTVKAETVGKGARIIIYDEPEQARFHLARWREFEPCLVLR